MQHLQPPRYHAKRSLKREQEGGKIKRRPKDNLRRYEIVAKNRRGFIDSISKKEFLRLKMPTEEINVSDQRRIELALNTLGYDPVTFPLKVLRKFYPFPSV